MQAHNQWRGFSLVEMMIVVAIVGVMSVIATPSFTQWIESSRIGSTTESIVAGLQIAKNEAIRRNTVVQFTLNTNTGWSLGCKFPETTKVNGLEKCPTIIKKRDAKEGAHGLTATITPASATSVAYSGFGRVIGGEENPITQIDVAGSTEASPLRILVTGGSVRVCNPAMASGNLGACS